MTGFARLALWFDNPNKAAVFLACLALLALFVALRSRRIVCPAFAGCVSLAAFAGLVLTFSRGGLLSFTVAAGISLALTRRTFTRRRLQAALIPLVTCVVFAGLVLFASGRISAGRLVDDRSVGNRLILWRAAPRMMADAPGGWGLDRSGEAFMSWYQPLDRHEEYRSLVSSHLTWLVEFGRLGRLAYAAGWLFVLGVCALRAIRRGDPIPLSLWTCFGIASGFSSVAESWELWALPLAALPSAFRTFFETGASAERRTILAVALIGGTVLVSGLEAYGRHQTLTDTPPLRKGERRLSLGSETPRKWVVSDTAVLGGVSYGRTLRRYLKAHPDENCGLAESLSDVPADVERLAVGGTAASRPDELKPFTHLRTLRILSPRNPVTGIRESPFETHVFIGEFAPGAPAEDLPNLTRVSGCGVYLPEWPRFAFD